MKKYRSRIIVGSVFLLPAFFYILLSLGKHQYKKLEYYGKDAQTISPDKAPQLDNQFFINQKSDTVQVKDFQGKITLWHLINTRDYLLTPAVIANLQYLQDRFSDSNNIQFVSLVHNETHAKDIQDFIKLLAIQTDNWQILYSDSIKNNNFAQEKLYFTYKNLPDSLNTVVPSVQVVLTDQNLHIRGYFDGSVHKETKGELLDAIDMLIREPYVIYKKKK